MLGLAQSSRDVENSQESDTMVFQTTKQRMNFRVVAVRSHKLGRKRRDNE